MSTNFIVKNLKEFQNALEKADKDRIKAAQDATKIEAFRLMGELKKELQAGAPGGKTLSPLTEMAKKLRSRRLINKRNPNKPPLYMFGPWVRYKVEKVEDGYKVDVGFVSPQKGGGIPESKLSYLVGRPQRGGTQSVTDPLISMLVRLGSKGKKKLNPFFLRKTTKTLQTPARPIIEPFWDAHKDEADRNIAANFYRKMRGERI